MGMPANRIAAITFTNKAAAEMRERAKALIGKGAKDVLVCTFHALGVRMLREDGAVLGLKPQFSILDSDDVTSILKDAGGTVDAATARQWQWTISAWKSAGLTSAEALAQAADDNERIIATVMGRYEERLTAYQSVDFDDLISLPLKLLRDYPEVRERWQAKLGHVLVDEYQDTNFPTLKVIKLEQNYRSTSAILRAANNVIGPNPKLFPKTLFSELGEGEPVRVVDADNEEHEAERAVARIQSLRAEGLADMQGKQYKEFRDFAVLYRANHQAKPFEKALRRAGIPYKVSGGQSFFDRAEIRDLCAWFRLWSNNDDDPAFLRAVTTPKRGIGHTTLGTLGVYASQYKLSLFEALFSSSLAAALSAKALGSLHEFGRYINDLEFRARHTEGAEAATAFMAEWLKEIGYEKHLYDGEESEKVAAAKWTNVLEFCDWMAQRCGGQIEDVAGVTAREVKSLLEVAQTIALLSTISEREKDQDVVTLSTLHASKGLEWPHVMLVGVTEGMLPFKLGDGADTLGGSSMADEAANDDMATRLQEERRLMYVGITRAQRSLAVSWTRRRKKGREMVAALPSRFIAEMGLDQTTVREDPREKLRALRAEFAAKAQANAAHAAAQK